MEISEAEWEIIRVVWANGQVTSSEIVSVLSKKTSWKTSTVKTLLSRLVQKNYLVANKSGNKFIYQATISENEAIKHKLSHLMSQVCAKKQGEVLHSLIEQVEMTQSDITELLDLLEHKKQTAPDSIACNCIPGQCTCHLEGGK
ncbi:CopY/TcrY family copper transport repressor [Vagococcus xieshaowenii]|uniref:CopY/TcrY family copper transport repressor n=1 Tax=Vagococcus xieshaowenii TaxID=2562451 RepID=A0AAJ5EET2_9ENTE|nr:CopY/TcrY family copper transport repressor [Vagococcus xieshaowenii]QCA28569.1 CopY/TcrY family copper transport repressor [Vagococcus xieshaowenii]TFZ40623.1 CopY/TcrY family copper transport repressor [Vagococcus xieshaowenii]